MTAREKLIAAVRAAIAHTDFKDDTAVFGDGYPGNGILDHVAVFFASSRLCAKSGTECKQEFTNYSLSLLSHLLALIDENSGTLGNDTANALLLRGFEQLPPQLSNVIPHITPSPAAPVFPALPDEPDAAPATALLALCDLSLPLLLTHLATSAFPPLDKTASLVLPTLLPDGRSLLLPTAPPLPWLAALLLLSRYDSRFAPYAVRASSVLSLPEETLPIAAYEHALAKTVLLLALAADLPEDLPLPSSFIADTSYADENLFLVRGKQRSAALCDVRNASFAVPSDAASLYTDPYMLTHVTLSTEVQYLPEAHAAFPYKGGFLAFRKECVAPKDAEGTRLLTLFSATAVLPDDETVLMLSFCRADAPVRILSIEDHLYTLSPDLSRSYYYHDAKRTLGARADAHTDVGRYLNIADRFGIVTQHPMTISACADGRRRISAYRTDTPIRPRRGEAVFRSAAAIAVGGIRRTRALADGFLTLDGLPHGILSVSAVAANRKRYTLLYNVTDTPFDWEAHTIAPETAVLLAWDR